jgi:hypothetical protein
VLSVDTLLHWNLLSGLINPQVLPLNLVVVAHDFLANLREYAEAAPQLAELVRLRELSETFLGVARALECCPIAGGDTASGMRNTLLLRVAKALNPVLHHALSDYEYDISRQSRLLPGLQAALSLDQLNEDDYQMATVALRRKANRIGQALSDATELIQSEIVLST